MKKVTLLAAMLAMVMVAAAPALAQSNAVGGNVQIQYQNAPQEINQTATATQSNTGGGTGAAIAQDLGIEQNAANVAAQAGDDINVGTGDDGVADGVFDGDDDGFAVAGNGATAVGGDVQIQNQYCPQVINQVADADQSNTGGGIGAGIAQDLGISQNAVNACLQAGGDINLGGDDGDDGDDTVVVHEDDGDDHADHDDAAASASATASSSAAASSSGGSSSGGSTASTSGGSSGGSVASAVYGALPDTGGLSLLALGGGVLLLGGGLVARRMFR